MIRFTLDKESRVRIATFEGVVDDTELFAAYQKLMSEEGFDPTLHHLADLRAVEHFAVSTAGLRQLVGSFTNLNGLGLRTKLAIVAAKDDVFGMARMYQVFRSDAPQELQIFRDMAEAKNWLGLPLNEE